MSTLCRCPYYYAVLVIRCLVGKIVSTLSSYISFPCMCGVSILWGKANQYYDISGTRLSRWICDCSSGTNSARPIWYDQIVEFVCAFPPNKYTSLTFPPKVFWSVSLSLCSIISLKWWWFVQDISRPMYYTNRLFFISWTWDRVRTEVIWRFYFWEVVGLRTGGYTTLIRNLYT